MNDASYGCIARLLADSLATAARAAESRGEAPAEETAAEPAPR
jgi:hypothetical protein